MKTRIVAQWEPRFRCREVGLSDKPLGASCKSLLKPRQACKCWRPGFRRCWRTLRAIAQAPTQRRLACGRVRLPRWVVAGEPTAPSVASCQRSLRLRQMPTFDEAGVKGFVVDTGFGPLAPARLATDALAALEREAREYARSASVRHRLQSLQGLRISDLRAQLRRGAGRATASQRRLHRA